MRKFDIQLDFQWLNFSSVETTSTNSQRPPFVICKQPNMYEVLSALEILTSDQEVFFFPFSGEFKTLIGDMLLWR